MPVLEHEMKIGGIPDLDKDVQPVEYNVGDLRSKAKEL